MNGDGRRDSVWHVSDSCAALSAVPPALSVTLSRVRIHASTILLSFKPSGVHRARRLLLLTYYL